MAARYSRHLALAGALSGLLAGGNQARAEGPAPGSKQPEATTDAAFLDPEIIGNEVVEIWDERPDKPFDRDTQARLTGEQLAQRGATDLAEALELLPDIYVREAGRGGRQIDIRGARKGSIKIMIDGIAVDDPYYGNFDLSSIPVTDIVQIRVSSSPASPIDGTGGPGGVIEVHTRDAIGARRIEARVQGSSLPSADAAVTGRSMLSAHWAMRASATGAMGLRDFTVAMPGDATRTLDEERSGGAGSLRLEYRRGDRRLVTDVWAQHRSFMVPPGEDGSSQILIIDGETATRGGVRAGDRLGAVQLEAHAYLHGVSRDSVYYADATLADEMQREELMANRGGVGVLANRPLGKLARLVGSASFDTENAEVIVDGGMPGGGRASAAALAAGIQFEDRGWKLDGAAGVAVPIGLGADPWPEAKLVLAYAPRRTPVTLRATGARKGRVPTLRERFRSDIGNEALGPEHAIYGEVAVQVAPSDYVRAEVASYVRLSNGLIRYDGERAALINTSDLTVRGVDARIEVSPVALVRTGVSWSFTDAYSPLLGTDPLDFLPQHRADGWISLSRAGFGGTARVQMVGEQLDRNDTLPRRATAELSGFARLPGSLTGAVKIGNVLDEEYELRAGGVRAPGRFLTLTVQGAWE